MEMKVFLFSHNSLSTDFLHYEDTEKKGTCERGHDDTEQALYI
jgi:hypothetical protein